MMMVPYFVAVILAVGGMEAPAPSPAELVRQLGADEFKAREAASAALREIGTAALPAVEAGSRNSDADIASRCRVLLRQLRQRQLLDQIEAVRGGDTDVKLPLLEFYRKRLGAEREAFELFASALVASSELLAAGDAAIARGDKESLSKLIEKQVAVLAEEFAGTSTPQAMVQDVLAANFADRLSAALLVAAFADVRVDDAAWDRLCGLLLRNLAFRERIKTANARGEALRKLLEQWCLTARSPQALTRALRQVLLYERRDAAAQLARRVLDDKGTGNPVLRGTAAEALGRYGTAADDMPRLLPLLNDQDEAFAGNLDIVAREVGDVAVLACVRLTGQQPAEYGVREAATELSIGAVIAPGGRLAQALRCPIPGFDSDDARRSAQAKLRQWLIQNSKLDSAALLAAACSTPAQFLERARLEAQQKVVCGSRFQVWTRGASNGEAFQSTISKGRIALLGNLFDPAGDRAGGKSGGTYDTPFGRAFVVRILGGATNVSINAVDVSSKDVVVETGIECRSTRALRFVRKEVTGETTTDIVYEQRDDALSLQVKRTLNRDGRVQLDETVSAPDLIALRKSAPATFATGLELLLSQLKLEIPTAESRCGGVQLSRDGKGSIEPSNDWRKVPGAVGSAGGC